MILHSLAYTIRKQVWAAVAIEFPIVVAGIFVGLQVTEWNERRPLRERDLNYLLRRRTGHAGRLRRPAGSPRYGTHRGERSGQPTMLHRRGDTDS